MICTHCGETLKPACPSDFFCSDKCQRDWSSKLAEPLPDVFLGFKVPQDKFERPAPTTFPVWHREPPVEPEPETVVLAPPNRSLVHDSLPAVVVALLDGVLRLCQHASRREAKCRN